MKTQKTMAKITKPAKPAKPAKDVKPAKDAKSAKSSKDAKNTRSIQKTRSTRKTGKDANLSAVVFQTFRWPVVDDVVEVCLAGDFNDWTPLPMERVDDGFQALVSLAPGEYQYKFLVDGQWVVDPAALRVVENGFGSTNGVLVVR